MLPLIGGLISAGAGLLGGMMNNSSQQSVNAQNTAAQERINAENIAATERANAANLAAQKEFAQHGLRWKTEDASRAGVHPLFALGAPSVSFSPSFVGSNSVASVSQHDPSMGNAIAQGGADIGRAIMATSTDDEKMRFVNESIAALQLERGSLENELLRTQIRRLTTAGMPSFPASNGGGSITSPLGAVPLGPHTSAQDVTDEYGEIVGEGAGITRFLHDWVKAAAEAIPRNRPSRIPGEPSRPAAGPFAPQLGGNYSRPRVAPGAW